VKLPMHITGDQTPHADRGQLLVIAEAGPSNNSKAGDWNNRDGEPPHYGTITARNREIRDGLCGGGGQADYRLEVASAPVPSGVGCSQLLFSKQVCIHSRLFSGDFV